MENKIITCLKELKKCLSEERDEWTHKQDEKCAQIVKSLSVAKEGAKDIINNYYKKFIDPIDNIINDYAEGDKLLERIGQCQQNLEKSRNELIQYIETQDFDMGLIMDKEQLKERINNNYKDIMARLDSLQKEIANN